MPEQRFNNDALKQHGYDNPSTPLIKLTLDASGKLTENAMSGFQPRPTAGIARGASEVVIGGFRVHCSNLYVPGLTQFIHKAPLSTMPKLHVYTTDALKTQAIADIKQGMRAVLTRQRKKAMALVDAIDEGLDAL